MAKTKKIQKFLNKQWYEMIHNLDALCPGCDNEKLHALRLNTKKIKAIVSLLEACLHKTKKFSLKKLKELFDHAGAIRAAHLNVDALHEHHIENKEFEKTQNQIIERECKNLCERKKTYSRNIKKLKKSIAINSSKINNKSILLYYHSSLEELSTNFLPRIKQERLHNTRKTIKRILLALKAFPGSLTNQININQQYLDDLQDLIGKWHDTIITLNLLGTDDPGYEILNDKKQLHLKAIENLTASFDKKVKISGGHFLPSLIFHVK